MKVIIDGKETKFVNIFRPSGGRAGNNSHLCNHWQCNTEGNTSAHNFSTHPNHLPKDTEIKTNGHTYIFPSK